MAVTEAANEKFDKAGDMLSERFRKDSDNETYIVAQALILAMWGMKNTKHG